MNYPVDFRRTTYIFQAWQDEDYWFYHVKKTLKINTRQKFVSVRNHKNLSNFPQNIIQ